jgi:hypothetical protein
MLAITLNPYFKALCVVENLVGHWNAIRLAFKYDAMVSFDWLNPTTTNTCITTIDVFGEDLKENTFGVGTTIEESLHALVIGELCFLKRLLICTCRSTCLMAHP